VSAILRSLGIPDLIAESRESYIRLAVTLGNDPELRQHYRQQIQEKMQAGPPFLDSRSYSAEIGAMFQQLFREYQESASS